MIPSRNLSFDVDPILSISDLLLAYKRWLGRFPSDRAMVGVAPDFNSISTKSRLILFGGLEAILLNGGAH